MQDSHTDNRAASASLNVTAPLDLDALSAALNNQIATQQAIVRTPQYGTLETECANIAMRTMAMALDAITALRERVGVLEGALGGMTSRHRSALQNWTQAAVDAQQSGNRELSVSIQNTVLTALGGFPIEEARAALNPEGAAS